VASVEKCTAFICFFGWAKQGAMEALDVRNAPDYDAEVEMAKWLEMELGAKPSYSQFFSVRLLTSTYMQVSIAATFSQAFLIYCARLMSSLPPPPLPSLTYQPDMYSMLLFYSSSSRIKVLTFFLQLAKDFYRVGRFDWSIYCIKQHMRDVPFERASSHLMGHCLFRQGKFEEATLELAKEVNKGFDEDWQLIIEGTIEHQRSRQEV